MAKQLSFSEEARSAMKRGIDTMADTVGVTLGPRGRNVVLDKKFGPPQVCSDGVTIAKEIELEDPFENMGAQLLKEAASKTNDVAGDGTTTSTVLAQAIIHEGFKNIAAGANPMALKRGMEKAAGTLRDSIKKLAKPVEGKEQIAQVAKVYDADFINLLTVPQNFFISGATGFASLGLDTDFFSDDAAAGGGRIKIRSRFSGFGGTTQRGHVFSVTASTMCHEFGHVLGLPDLFDQSSVAIGDELDPEQDSAGIGKWGLMGLGTLGWGIEDGPNAFSAWSLAQLGWVDVVEISSSRTGLVIDNIDAGGAVFKIPIGYDEYLLLENRQASDSYYNRNVPGTGLLVWHVDDQADNDEERHKRVDLVCADGLYSDRGFPGALPDPRAGRDNLDFWSKDSAYATEHSGNQGDAGDPFDGVRFTRLASDTNPGARVHTGRSRNLSMGFALENIRSVGGGRMMLDILIRQPLFGHIAADTTWSGRVSVDGDITVERGVTLRIEAGTTVEFARGDSRGSGFRERRGELLVYGNLELGTGADPVTLRSARASPRNGDWMGVFLMDGQSAGIDQALAAGRLVVSHSTHGLLRRRLPPGSTVWRAGTRRLPWDLVVPEGSILEVEAGAQVNFASDDLGASGRSAGLVELDIAGELRVRGTATRPQPDS